MDLNRRAPLSAGALSALSCRPNRPICVALIDTYGLLGGGGESEVNRLLFYVRPWRLAAVADTLSGGSSLVHTLQPPLWTPRARYGRPLRMAWRRCGVVLHRSPPRQRDANADCSECEGSDNLRQGPP